ncbi:MAG: hypothetical protein M1130_03900 [Actinobacteria bacterium]|nr:hypothetical protein [Actinomycetota bacterium]
MKMQKSNKKAMKPVIKLAAVCFLAVILSFQNIHSGVAVAGLPSTSYSYGFSSNITSYVNNGRTMVTLADIQINDGLEYLRVYLGVNVSCIYTSGMAEAVTDYIYIYGFSAGGSETYIGYISGGFWRTPAGSFGGTVTIPPGYSRIRIRAYWDSPYMANNSYCPSDWSLSGSVAYVGGYSSTTVEVQQATNAALQAKTSAEQAKASADAARASADIAVSAVSNVNGNTITAVRDTGGTVLEEAREANTRLNIIQTSIMNMEKSMADISPPSVKIRTASGALATSGGSIMAVLDISDNNSHFFTYSLDGVTYQNIPANRAITIPVSSPGLNLIPVWVMDQMGNIGTASITIRKL